jgi:predicted dehydrogenase
MLSVTLATDGEKQMSKVGVGLIGTGFVGDIHAAALATVADAGVTAVASATPGKARKAVRVIPFSPDALHFFGFFSPCDW